MLRLLLVLLLVERTASLTCNVCYNHNGAVCVESPDCTGNYCLYEERVLSSGVSLRKLSCMDEPVYVFDDGQAMEKINTCVRRTTSLSTTTVSVCDSFNGCNKECYTVRPVVTLPPPLPFVTHAPPVRTCFDCSSVESECSTGQCQGPYCLYEHILNADGSSTYKKGCVESPSFLFDDGTLSTAVNQCESRATNARVLVVKICDDSEYCNRHCDLSPSTPKPQRQPLVSCFSCEANGASECRTSNTCTGLYCVYSYQQRGASSFVRRTCSSQSFVEYPDGTLSEPIHTCQRKSISGETFVVQVCNTASYCNKGCANVVPRVRCTQCSATNADDCTSTTTCQAKYCLFERVYNPSTGERSVKRSCTNLPEIVYPDGSLSTTHAVNGCEQRNVQGRLFSTNICNTGDNCNTACGSHVNTPAPPMKDPRVTCFECSASGYDDCVSTGGGRTCTGNYCLFERQTRVSPTGQVSKYVKRSCDNNAYVEYPDATTSNPATSFNQCEKRSIHGVEFAVNICNNKNFCNNACDVAQGPYVTCEVCSAENANDCSGGGYTCEDTHCFYERIRDPRSGRTSVRKGCYNRNQFVFPDETNGTSGQTCDYRLFNGLIYSVNVCNSRNFCPIVCPIEPIDVSTTPYPTTTTTKAATAISLLIALLSTVFF